MPLQCHHQQSNKLFLHLKSSLERMALTVVSFYLGLWWQSLSHGESVLVPDCSNLWPICTGARKLAQIRENSNFIRTELRRKGFEVLGDMDSPVMALMLYNPGKIPAFSRECLKRNVRSDVIDEYETMMQFFASISRVFLALLLYQVFFPREGEHLSNIQSRIFF